MDDFLSSVPKEELLQTLLLKYPSLAQMILKNKAPLMENPSLLEKILLFLNLAEKQYVRPQENIAEKGLIR